MALLKTCAKQNDLQKGSRIHAEITERGWLEKSSYIGSAVVSMYAKCGALERARQVLHGLPARDVVSWNALITGYVQKGKAEEALNCVNQMQREGLTPDAVTFACALQACGCIGAAEKGERIHEEIMKQGLLDDNVILGTALMDMYAKCGALEKAQKLLHELPSRDVVSWNTLIAGYIHQGNAKKALSCIDRMRLEGFHPDPVTFACALRACGGIGAVVKGEQIHEQIVGQQLLKDNVILGTALVDMYAKCGAVKKAQQVLHELPVYAVTSWNALLAGYVKQDKGEEVLTCINQMRWEGLSLDAFSFTCALQACGSIGDVGKGEQIHKEIVKQGLLENDAVLNIALMDMYAKCGVLEKAWQVFHESSIQSVVSWNALIAGYVQQEKGQEALNFVDQMRHEGLSPDAVTFVCALRACGSAGAADKGEQIHDEVVKHQLLENNVILGTSLVDMYAKCGALGKAARVLQNLPVRDVVSWNALITGYTLQGKCNEVVMCLDQMQLEGHSPNAVTFLCGLNACSHSGLLAKGQAYFANLSTKYGLTPGKDHHCCMIDLFGRLGKFDEALAVIARMPFSEDLFLWHTLLGACQKWKNVEFGRLAFEHAVRIDLYEATAYLLMSHIYIAAGMYEDAYKIEDMRMRNKAWKIIGHSK